MTAPEENVPAPQSKPPPRFIVDKNAGKLVKLLRLMGYDAVLFDSGDDSVLVTTAMSEDRIILTRDTRLMERRVITTGRVKALLIESDVPEEQIRQVISALKLDCKFKPFTRCIECNQPLAERSREEVKELVPPYVLKTQPQFMQCPACGRVYWQGTHWQRMSQKLERIRQVCT